LILENVDLYASQRSAQGLVLVCEGISFLGN